MAALIHNKTLLTVILIGLLSGCDSNTKPAPTASQATAAAGLSLNQWFNARYEEELQFSPIQLSFLGRKERNHELGSVSYAAFTEQLAWKKQTVEELRRLYDYDSLTPAEQISYDIWIYQYEQAAASAEYFYNGLSFDQMSGIQSFIPTFLINFHRVEDESDLRAYIARIKDVAPRMEEMLETAQKSADAGVVSPGFALDGVIDQASAIIDGRPFTETTAKDSDLWADFQQEAQALVTQQKISQEVADALMQDATIFSEWNTFVLFLHERSITSSSSAVSFFDTRLPLMTLSRLGIYSISTESRGARVLDRNTREHTK